MKNRYTYLLVTPIAIGTALGVAIKNIPAGVFIGAGNGMLAIVLFILFTAEPVKNKRP